MRVVYQAVLREGGVSGCVLLGWCIRLCVMRVVYQAVRREGGKSGCAS